MPDEVSHLLWTYLALKHPRLKEFKDFQSRRGVAAAYFFTLLPDLANLTLILVFLWVMVSNNLPLVAGPEALNYPQVQEVFNSPIRSIYFTSHSYVTLAVLLLVFYIPLGRFYWPLFLGMGFAITLDIFTHKDLTALKPFYPLSDFKVNGIIHWGDWRFYTAEAIFFAAYTLWLFRKQTQK